MFGGKNLTKAARESRLQIDFGLIAVEERDQKIRAHPYHNRFRRDCSRVPQNNIALALLLHREGFDGSNLWLVYQRTDRSCS
jgi:hypothetical protein